MTIATVIIIVNFGMKKQSPADTVKNVSDTPAIYEVSYYEATLLIVF
jgi:hypothetical protein